MRLTHSRSTSCSCWRLEISHTCQQSCYVPAGLPTAPIFETFTSSAEESNPKLPSPNAFLSSQCLKNVLVAGLCCPRHCWRSLQRSPKSPSWTWGGRFVTENEKRKEGEGQGWKKGEKENRTLHSFVSLRALQHQDQDFCLKSKNSGLILIMSHLKLTPPLDLYAETLMLAIPRSKREHIKHWFVPF